MEYHVDSDNVIHGPEDLFGPPDVTLGRYIRQLLPLHEEKIAQIDAETGACITFDEILTKSLSIAGYLHTQGVRPGDVISICSENHIQFFLPVLGTLFVGATCAPLNPAYTTRELEHTLNISRPSFIFCSEGALERVDQVSRHLGFVKGIITFGNRLSHRHIPFSQLLQDTSKSFEPVDGDPNELVAVILCSSGTTGLPKGVMLTHKNILTSMSLITDPRYFDRDPSAEPPVTVGFLPFFHAMSFMSILIQITYGAKCIVLKKFNEDLLLKTIQNYKVSALPLVPAIAVFLAKAASLGKYDLSSIKIVQSGAAPLSEDIEIKVKKRLGAEHVGQGYGMTETTLGVLVNPVNKGKHGSVGVLVPATLCKIVDQVTGKNLGPNKEGELCFKGPIIMKGYCRNPEETAAMIDADGFLHTGDIGYYDKDGFFYVVDRIKELIKYKAYQVPPAELEAVLLTHPAIKDAGVTAVPDESAGELPVAFVVKQPGKHVTKEEIIKFVEGQVSPQKRLRGGVIFIDSLPRTPSGKILRRELKNLTKSKL